jgi:cytochrome c553
MRRLTTLLLPIVLLPGIVLASEGEKPRKVDYPHYPPAPEKQAQAEADRKSAGCVSCHARAGRASYR